MGGSWAMNQSRLPPVVEVPSSAKMSGMAAASVACRGMVAWLTESLALSICIEEMVTNMATLAVTVTAPFSNRASAKAEVQRHLQHLFVKVHKVVPFRAGYVVHMDA